MESDRWQSKRYQRGCDAIDRVCWAYGESVGEGGGLGGGRQRNRRGEASLHGLDGLESRTTPKSLVEVESQSAGSHCGQLEWVRGGKGGDGEKSWTRPEVEVRKSNCSPSSSANHMTLFSKRPISSRLLPCAAFIREAARNQGKQAFFLLLRFEDCLLVNYDHDVP